MPVASSRIIAKFAQEKFKAGHLRGSSHLFTECCQRLHFANLAPQQTFARKHDLAVTLRVSHRFTGFNLWPTHAPVSEKAHI